MNYKKLSELPVAEAISGEDTVPIVQGGSTKKAAIDKIIGSTTKEITVLKGEIDSVSDSVNALWKLNEGISFDFVTDSVEANTKTVPNGGKYAAVEKIGGKTVVCNEQYAETHPEYNVGELISVKAENIKYNAAIIGDIPAAVQTLPGYGWSAGGVHNSIERTENGWQYVQRVECVDLGQFTWKYTNSSKFFYFDNLSDIITVKYSDDKANPNILVAKYITSIYSKVILTNKSVSISNNYTNGRIIIKDLSFESADNFKTAMNGVMLYYELAESIVTDITDLMVNFPKIFAVEAGGTITFDNDTGLSVPSEIKYVRKLSEVGA